MTTIKDSSQTKERSIKILETREERIKLLRSGFSAKEVEALYIDLNHFETIGVNWGDASTNRTYRRITISSSTHKDRAVRVQVASSLGMMT